MSGRFDFIEKNDYNLRSVMMFYIPENDLYLTGLAVHLTGKVPLDIYTAEPNVSFQHIVLLPPCTSYPASCSGLPQLQTQYINHQQSESTFSSKWTVKKNPQFKKELHADSQCTLYFLVWSKITELLLFLYLTIG